MVTERWRRIFLVPPFILGACLAVASKVAVGLLLYGGVGFIEALSVILATLAGALAFGMWTGRGIHPDASVEGVRRRWLLTLVSFTAAVVFSGAWEYFGAFGVRPWSQAMGLALLAGLPLFFGGSLLGAMTRAGSVLHPPPGVSRLSPGVAAILGTAAGFMLAGFVLFPRFSAPHLLLVCVVLLSAGALVHGWILDQVILVRNVERRASDRGELRVDHWVRGRPRSVLRALQENDRLRGLETEQGDPRIPAEVALQHLLPGLRDPRTVLFVGGGAMTVPCLLRRYHPDARIVVLEENQTLTDLAYSHFAVSESDRIEIHHGPPDWRLVELLGEVDAIVVSGSFLAGGNPIPVALRDLLPWFDTLLGADGVVVAYGFPIRGRQAREGLLSPEVPDDPPLKALLDESAARFAPQYLYSAGEDALLVLGPIDPDPPVRLDGFELLWRSDRASEGTLEATPGGV